MMMATWRGRWEGSSSVSGTGTGCGLRVNKPMNGIPVMPDNTTVNIQPPVTESAVLTEKWLNRHDVLFFVLAQFINFLDKIVGQFLNFLFALFGIVFRNFAFFFELFDVIVGAASDIANRHPCFFAAA